jgi:hypothetical protein
LRQSNDGYEGDEAEQSFSGALRTLSFWIANGTVGLLLLEGIDYGKIPLAEPSALERVYAIFVNVIEVDEYGAVQNTKCAGKRAAQWLRSYIDPTLKFSSP